ncbi:MAG: hypothetical protein OXB84_07380 [Halobacteriovoraceae bacterium]|nr:hypothetical protein [Halobacteriovoraceae bacterium]
MDFERRIKIVATAGLVPQNPISAEDIDRKLNVKEGYTLKKSGAKIRYYAQGESSSELGAKAATFVLKNAGMDFKDIDLLICANATPEQAIPCTAALVQNKMGQGNSGTPCYDINATCLSFIAAMDTVSYMVAAGKYRRVLIVSTEVVSAGINWHHKESAILFGDGAVAVIIESTPEGEGSNIHNSLFKTFGDLYEYVSFPGGGTKMMADKESNPHHKKWGFHMSGHNLMKFALKRVPGFITSLLEPTRMTLNDLNLIIPHQASGLALELMKKKLKVRDEQFFLNISERGNIVAASIPMALHDAIEKKRLKRKDTALLIGTGAGLSLGGLVIEY